MTSELTGENNGSVVGAGARHGNQWIDGAFLYKTVMQGATTVHWVRFWFEVVCEVPPTGCAEPCVEYEINYVVLDELGVPGPQLNQGQRDTCEPCRRGTAGVIDHKFAIRPGLIADYPEGWQAPPEKIVITFDGRSECCADTADSFHGTRSITLDKRIADDLN